MGSCLQPLRRETMVNGELLIADEKENTVNGELLVAFQKGKHGQWGAVNSL